LVLGPKRVLFLALKVTLVEDEVKQVDDVHLHCIILFLNDVVKSFYQRLHNDVRDLIGDARVFLDLLQDQLHELASRGVDCEGLRESIGELVLPLQLTSSILRESFLGILGPDELESDFDKDVQVK
jgi:hypothetical protein